MFNNKKIELIDYHLFSGGARGSDIMFETVGREFGLTNFHHFWYKRMNPFSKLEDEITEEDYLEGVEMVHKANDLILKRKNIDRYMYLLARNWSQVKYSDSVYAISQIKGNIVNGGTGYATSMAIITDKPLYVFDQEKEQWYFWYNDKFEVCVTPKLSRNFAGIGTREINTAGVDAIRMLYQKTFNTTKTLT